MLPSTTTGATTVVLAGDGDGNIGTDGLLRVQLAEAAVGTIVMLPRTTEGDTDEPDTVAAVGKHTVEPFRMVGDTDCVAAVLACGLATVAPRWIAGDTDRVEL